MSIVQVGDFFRRVVRNDSFRKGLASAGAGVILAAIFEAVWPSA
jgi:hypothetical protein